MLREPAVQGMFYPSSKDELTSLLQKFFTGLERKPESDVIIAPHAGFIYSGRIAAQAFSKLSKHSTYVIISPNHSGLGQEISVYPQGEWENCLGKVGVDDQAVQELQKFLPEVALDKIAHIQEHSIEVLLPFLQFLFKDFKIVPITLMLAGSSKAEKLAEALYKLSQEKSIGLIASSDFSHHIPLEAAREKDLPAIKLIEALDVGGFDRVVKEKHLSICGFAAVEVAMHFARLKGLKQGKLIEYSTSAETTGDSGSVVGYAAIEFK